MSKVKCSTVKVVTAGNCPVCGKKIESSNPLICDECAEKLSYEELIRDLRNCAKINSLSYYKRGLMIQAADAIEELLVVCKNLEDELKDFEFIYNY